MFKTRRFILKAVMTVVFLFGASAATERPARAQFGVVDPLNISTSVVNSVREVAQMVNQIGILTDELEWIDQIMDFAQKAQQILQDAGTLVSMYKSLQSQLNMMKIYGQRLMKMESEGFDPSVILMMKSQLESSYYLVKSMIEQGMRILSEIGLSLSDKIDKGENYARRVKNVADENAEDLRSTMDFIEVSQGILQVDNFLDGKSPNDGLNYLNPTYISDMPYVSYDAGEAYKDGGAEIRSLNLGSKSIFYLLLGFILVLSLLVVMVRYMRGDPRSEMGFFRIFVVMVLGAVLATVLQAVLKIGL